MIYKTIFNTRNTCISAHLTTHNVQDFDNSGMPIIMLLSNVKLYFRDLRNNTISFVSESAFVNLPNLTSL